jgi:2-polyprenyl-3-methyl-5-hydroxy-6-metoxy-1,4-benzoquinol methylase
MAPVTPERIFTFFNGYVHTAAIKAGVDLDLFTAIAEGMDTADAIARYSKASPKGVRALCDYLCVAGLLSKQGDRYSLAPDAAMFLDRRQPSYLGAVGRFLTASAQMAHFTHLAEAVRHGGSPHPDGGNVSWENPVWIDFAHGMMNMMYPAAVEIGHILGAPQAEPWRVLDIAAGHGIFGIQIAQQNPNAHITALDWPQVLEVAHGHAVQFGVADRWTRLPGSAFEAALPEQYDVVLLTNFLHHFDPPTNTALLKKLHAHLKPGGRAVTLEFIVDETRLNPPVAGAFALMMLGTTSSGDAYTFAELAQMFSDAGFSKNEHHMLQHSPEQMIVSHA